MDVHRVKRNREDWYDWRNRVAWGVAGTLRYVQLLQNLSSRRRTHTRYELIDCRSREVDGLYGKNDQWPCDQDIIEALLPRC